MFHSRRQQCPKCHRDVLGEVPNGNSISEVHDEFEATANESRQAYSPWQIMSIQMKTWF